MALLNVLLDGCVVGDDLLDRVVDQNTPDLVRNVVSHGSSSCSNN